MKDSNYVRYDNQFHKPSRGSNNLGMIVLALVTLVLVSSAVILGVLTIGNQNKEKSIIRPKDSTSVGDTANTSSSGIAIATPTPTPVEERLAYQNPILYPAIAQMNVEMGTPGAGMSPSERSATQVVQNGDSVLSPYERTIPIAFGDPLYYQTVPGILSFRGNNFRNCASWGTVDVTEGVLEQVWEYNGVGSMSSSSWSFSWTGTGWTGQPLAVSWDYDVQQLMNMYPEKKAKQNLTEIIIAAMDGKVYFFDVDDGQMTRDPITVGATIKGTPAVDPRGYPILYVGQGDSNGADGKIGFRIYNLMTGELMYFQSGLDSRAYRSTWGACDSSPIVCAAADTLIYPNENGMIYTLKLNTEFDKGTGRLSINPETVVFKYELAHNTDGYLGIESSMAVYDHYGYASDNTGNLICVDLNSMSLVWARQLDDDSDVTPVIEEENGHVYLYTGTEVDYQRTDALDYMGASYTYKLDAMTGEVVWQTSQSCYTHNGATSGDDVNGGMLGTAIVGKNSISNLVIFSYCMTNGIYSGNRLVAYDKTTGTQVWAYEMNLYSWSSPVDVYDDAGNAYIVMCDSGGQIHLVNAQNGQRITYLQTLRNMGTANEVSTGLNMESSPIVVNGMIVIGSRAGSIFGVKIK